MTDHLGMKWYRLLAAGLMVVSVAAGCSSDGSDPSAADPDAAASDSTSDPAAASTTTRSGRDGTEPAENVFEEDPEFVEGDCWWGRSADLPEDVTITCGTISVPADRTAADSDLLQLATVRVHRAGADADAPPIVTLHGGPGGDSLTSAPTADTLPLDALEERDMILYDQRGAGRSTPSLNCPEKEEATLAALGTADDWSVEFAANEAAAVDCKQRLEADGIDLADYDTLASVEDLETIRAAFGVDTWNVSGRSYGTRLGLAYARDHPESVRSLLIDSVYAPDVGSVERNKNLPRQALERLSAACAEDDACAAANGDVAANLEVAVAAFDAEPETLTGTVPVGDEEITQSFTLTGSDLRGGMYAALYRQELIPQLPAIIAGLANGDRSIVAAFLSTGVPGLLDMSEGAFFSFECADSQRNYGPDGVAAMREDPGDDALYALGTAEPFCQAWGVPSVPASFNEPVTVDVPTLTFGGTLDPITPYVDSVAQADRMPDARFVGVPGGGHGDANHDDCTRLARARFWDDPAGALPACTDSIPQTPFTT